MPPKIADNHNGVRRRPEDDLALFNEVKKNKEKENFLLQSNEDFDDTFSKLKHFSGYKFGVSTPGESHSCDLLNAGGDKKDYNWLITPPESPLFASLDDDAQAFRYLHRGRLGTQPVPISRGPSTMERGGYRSSARGSSSPNRLSPSPRSGNTMSQQPRSRPFSVTHSSPPHTSPSRRAPPSPPPSKPTQAPISGAQIPGRFSTGSLTATQSRTRGISPVRMSLGTSASPKIKNSSQTNPGFSCKAQPNLCADRKASYVRGSSPASRNGRQSISPTACRSVSSSHSHERDPFSKKSVAPSGVDDLDSVLSNPVPISIVASKKPSAKTFFSSAPKRCHDLSLGQLDIKGPQHMFRPLLSSVPGSTFYSGKGPTQPCSLASRNYSFTTSSNASSDEGKFGEIHIEEVEKNRDDISSDLLKKLDDDVFAVDQFDVSDQDDEDRLPENPRNDNPSSEAECHPANGTILVDTAEIALDENQCIEICSKCHRSFHTEELIVVGDQLLCSKCKSSGANPTSLLPAKTVMEDASATKSSSVPELKRAPSAGEIGTGQLHNIVNMESQYANYVTNRKDLATSSTEELSVVGDFARRQKEPFGIFLNSPTGKKPRSDQGHVIPSRSYTASSTSYDDFSYTRSSNGHSSVSMSSSLDLGFSRETEFRIHRQSGGSKSDIENYRYEVVKHEHAASSASGATSNMIEISSTISSSLEDGFRITAANKAIQVRGVTHKEIHYHSLTSECTVAESVCTDVEKTTDSRDNSMLLVLTSDEPSSLEKAYKLTRNFRESTSEGMSTSNLRISGEGGDDSQNPCFDVVDAAEDLHPVLSAESHSSEPTNLKNRANEMVGHASVIQDDHITTDIEEPDVSDAENAPYEEPSGLPDDTGGASKSGTLEEATDVILLCNSIVHEIAYNAANIAINRESSPAGTMKPAPAFPSGLSSGGKEIRSRTKGRRSKVHKTRPRKSDTEPKSPKSVLAEDEGVSTPRIVMPPAVMESSTIPPKLDSKCNCTIM